MELPDLDRHQTADDATSDAQKLEPQEATIGMGLLRERQWQPASCSTHTVLDTLQSGVCSPPESFTHLLSTLACYTVIATPCSWTED